MAADTWEIFTRVPHRTLVKARTKLMAGAGVASKLGYSAAAAEERRAGAEAGISACRERAASLATGSRRLADAVICAPPTPDGTKR